MRRGVLIEMDALTGHALRTWLLPGAPDVTFFNPASGIVRVAVGDPDVVQTINPLTEQAPAAVPTRLSNLHVLPLPQRRFHPRGR